MCQVCTLEVGKITVFTVERKKMRMKEEKEMEVTK